VCRRSAVGCIFRAHGLSGNIVYLVNREEEEEEEEEEERTKNAEKV
jgi:hypothetical protein